MILSPSLKSKIFALGCYTFFFVKVSDINFLYTSLPKESDFYLNPHKIQQSDP